MDDLAAKIIADIDTGYLREPKDTARDYIGASMAGTDCIAELQLSLRGFPSVTPDPRLKRIFFAGHRIEEWVVYDLKKRADLRVWEKDDTTGRQHRREWLGGHIVCHADGLVNFEDGSDDLAILEIKSMNDARFKQFEKHGIKSANRKYYRQATMMMAMFAISRTLFVAYNKNDSQLHAEIIPFDEEEWGEMFIKIQSAIDGHSERVASTPNDWRCKSCFKREACWQPPVLPPECRFCLHSKPSEDGTWLCKKGKDASEVCNEYSQFQVSPKGG